MIKIGERSFTVPPPGGMRSFALQQRILPIATRVATVFIRLIGAAPGDLTKILESDVMRVLPQALPQVGEIFAQMAPGELEAVTRTLLGDPKTGAQPWEVALCDKAPLFGSPGGDSFDGVMAGRTTDTWRLLWHALEIWYPDFFASARALFAKGAKPVNHSEELTTLEQPGPASA
jgi:hypothetical protein